MCTQGDVLKHESEEKVVREQLQEAVQEASSIKSNREAMMQEKRELERSLRELGQKSKHFGTQIKEKAEEKRCLETTRENCIAM
jgi:uncharacterized protein (DUF3084 family)